MTQDNKPKNKHARLSGGGNAKDRVENDLYETPEYFVRQLLEIETFHTDILEPACGNGRISKTLIANHYNVLSSDLVVRSYQCEVKDFIKDDFEVGKYDIITNPPYKYMLEFINKASLIAKNKFAFVGRVQLLEGVQRYSDIYQNGINGFRLARVLCSSRRVNFITTKKFDYASAMMVCWFIFEKNYFSDPAIKWINYNTQQTTETDLFNI